MNELVSIVAANYNCAQYISEFIESILSQSYQNWELIIVDDGSNDGSQKIVESYSKKDSRILLVYRENPPKGANHCRNIGLQRAVGKYICFFDTDDLLPEYAVMDRVIEMENNPQMDFIIFPAITFKKVPYDYNNLVLGFEKNGDDTAMFLKRYRLPFAVWTNVYKRDYLIEHGICWDNELMSMQDSDFNLSVLRTSVNYKYSQNKKPNYFWRKIDNGSNITQTIKTVKNLDSQLYFFNKLKRIYHNTKYAEDLTCFRLTLLHRFIYLNYSRKPKALIYGKLDNIKYEIIKLLFSIIHISNEKFSYVLFMSFYPMKFLQELYYRHKNNSLVKSYFRNICNLIC